MNVEILRLVNFKRFADLTIDLSSLDGAPKLVLLIGANRTGKSSVFDAFEYLSGPHKGSHVDFPDYIRKDGGTRTTVVCSLGGGFKVNRSDSTPALTTPKDWNTSTAFYGRSSFRTIPQLRTRQASVDVAADADRPRRYIDHDTRFEADISEITRRILEEVWGTKFNATRSKHSSLTPSTTHWRGYLATVVHRTSH